MLDAKKVAELSEAESPVVRKDNDSVILLNQRYNTPNTSLLLFHFEPSSNTSSELRLKNSKITHHTVEGKDIYLFDQFFLDKESAEMRNYSKNATFSRTSYASDESRDKGEDPARSMNNKEKWLFFAKPPQAINEIYKFLGFISDKLQADVSTLPWDICNEKICASAVATNRLEKVSHDSMKMGKHEDFNTAEGLPFGIPILYAKEKSHFPAQFENGSEGNPWLVSLMVYATDDNFVSPDYGLGTVFCKKNGDEVVTADCLHMRFVIFEGDILHTIEESKVPSDIHTWRVSYVYKLIINPKQPNKSMKQELHKLLRT